MAPVRAGMEESLRQTLNAFGNDVEGTNSPVAASQPRITFVDSHSIHFARLALLDDPDRGHNRKRLLLTTDYDGPEADHLQEVIARTNQPELIWGCCEGYEGPSSFSQFIRAHIVQPETYYIAFRGEDLPQLRRSIALNDLFQSWLADPNAEKVFGILPNILFFGTTLRRVGQALWLPFDIVLRGLFAAAEVIQLMARLGLRTVIDAAMCINATLDRVWWIRPLNFLFNNRPTSAASPYSQASPNPPSYPIPAGYPPEDAVLQNQLTLVTDVKPECLARLRAVLALIDLYGRRLSTPGSLVGISTIHTVRWAILDEGKRLLMVSNYDGTWENYLDEFAEMILSGLNALWTSAPDFPLTGAQDVAALKQFLRSHQVAANVFYSAYPATSVLNLKQNLEFASWFGWIVRYLTGGKKPGDSPVPSRP